MKKEKDNKINLCYIGRNQYECKKTISCNNCVHTFDEGVQTERLRTKKRINDMLAMLRKKIGTHKPFIGADEEAQTEILEELKKRLEGEKE
jgi:hypothetical protein